MKCCENPMAQLASKIELIKPFEESIGKNEIELLARRMISDSESEKELSETVEYFFSLNSADAIATMERMRKLSYENLLEDGEKEQAELLRSNEKKIDELVRQMYRYAEEKFNMPFHLAAALGKLDSTDSFYKDASLNAKSLGFNHGIEKGQCPMWSFPNYVGYKWPWKLSIADRGHDRSKKRRYGLPFCARSLQRND